MGINKTVSDIYKARFEARVNALRGVLKDKALDDLDNKIRGLLINLSIAVDMGSRESIKELYSKFDNYITKLEKEI